MLDCKEAFEGNIDFIFQIIFNTALRDNQLLRMKIDL
jgi:hypothetical protein